MQVYGIDAIVRIVSHFSFIYLAFWALRSLRIENLFNAGDRNRLYLQYIFFRNHSFVQKYLFDI